MMKKMMLSMLLTLFSTSLMAGDRIGNGGGVWVCEDNQLQIHDIMFMDVYEARREYQLTLPEITVTALENVQIQKDWIRKNMADADKIIQHIEYVEKNITWIDEILNIIPDGANKISPPPATCRQGKWSPVQLVNFTDDFRILVRREIFNSEMLTELERSAVYLHEGFYSYLRTEYGDSNSVRARALTGFVLSNLPDAEKMERIRKQLTQAVPDPNPPPELGWICGFRPDRNTALYTGSSKNKNKAIEDAVNSCTVGENPFGKNPTFPGFPQLPMPGPQDKCVATNVYCEEIKSQNLISKCVLNDFFDRKVSEGAGRTKLEAQKAAISQCMGLTGNANTCYSTDKLICL